MYFYQRLRDLREDKDQNQSEIADILKITRQQYQLYESGKREIPFHCIIELAKHYRVSIDYVAGITKSKQGINRSDLSDTETQVLNMFRELTEKQKNNILGRLEAFTEENSEEQDIENAI